MNGHSRQSGFSFVEILIVIAIMAIALVLVIPPMKASQLRQLGRSHVESIESLFFEARGKTLSSENLSNYGLHLEDDRVILFAGTSYDSDETINEFIFDSRFEITDISLAGASEDIVFERLSGSTTDIGTFTLESNDGTITYIFTVNGTGILDLSTS